MYLFAGIHVIVDAYEIERAKFEDDEQIKTAICQGIQNCGAQLIELFAYHLQPEGFTILAALKESHISMHAYPEIGSMFIDAFTCGDTDPQIIIDSIMGFLNPGRKKITVLQRGNERPTINKSS